MSEVGHSRGKYKTTNRAEYNAALKARGSLTVWLDTDMQLYAPAIGKRCRQPTFYPTSPARRHWTCSSTAPESVSRVKATGRKKHGAEYRRQWRKVHLGIDARTLEIRAIEVTNNSTGDALMRSELLSQIIKYPFAQKCCRISISTNTSKLCRTKPASKLYLVGQS